MRTYLQVATEILIDIGLAGELLHEIRSKHLIASLLADVLQQLVLRDVWFFLVVVHQILWRIIKD
jgi:hypothetical protein